MRPAELFHFQALYDAVRQLIIVSMTMDARYQIAGRGGLFFGLCARFVCGGGGMGRDENKKRRRSFDVLLGDAIVASVIDRGGCVAGY